MFWCTNCQGKCYIDPYLYTQTSFNRIQRSKRIDKLVRLSSSLNLMKKKTLIISKERKTPYVQRNNPNGTSDRENPSKNPITKKKGVDKKHGSYDRYLALKKGNIIRSDTWKYANQYGNIIYTPYTNPNKNCKRNMQCCCVNNCNCEQT